jgi:hypothetical protein
MPTKAAKAETAEQKSLPQEPISPGQPQRTGGSDCGTDQQLQTMMQVMVARFEQSQQLLAQQLTQNQQSLAQQLTQ